jgi:hypothetical protein
MGTSDVGADLISEHASTLGPTFMSSLPSALVAPEHVASPAMSLASDDAFYVTEAGVSMATGTMRKATYAGNTRR